MNFFADAGKNSAPGRCFFEKATASGFCLFRVFTPNRVKKMKENLANKGGNTRVSKCANPLQSLNLCTLTHVRVSATFRKEIKGKKYNLGIIY